MVQPKEDRRVQRTRQLLSSALLKLIEERGYDSLTVNDITEQANVGRATFYLHYQDKEQLLVAMAQAPIPPSRRGSVAVEEQPGSPRNN